METTLTEGLSAKEALALFNEYAGLAAIKEATFHYRANSGKIAILPDRDANGNRLYDRLSVIAHALFCRDEEEKKRAHLSKFLPTKDAVEYVLAKLKEALGDIPVSFDEYELKSLADNGSVPVKTETFKGVQYRLYDPADLDVIAPKIAERLRLEEKAKGLMDTRAAVAWINARLEEQERETYDPDVLLDIFYHWVGDGKVEKSLIVPGKSGNFFWRYYFSEEVLEKAPCFVESIAMPDDVKPIMVKGTKDMKKLEDQWGELITKHGADDYGLSRYAINKRVKVKPVGFMGPSKIYPAKYIPQKRRRKANLDI